MLSISEESEEPAPEPVGSMSNNHVLGLSPYQICPNGTVDAEPEDVSHDSLRDPKSVSQRIIKDITLLFDTTAYI